MTVDIFVGTDRSQALAVSVLEHSIRRHASLPVRVHSMVDIDLPNPKDVRHSARTNFSFARFAIPQLKGYSGKAIYMDADMLVFGDVAELWSIPFDGATVIIQEALPERAILAGQKDKRRPRRKQSSVMLIDCARATWDPLEIIAGLDGLYSYDELMTDICILAESDISYRIPFEWNSLEHYEPGMTRLLHYTDMPTQPWVHAGNRLGYLWMEEVWLMLESRKLSWGTIRKEIELGYMRPSLIKELRDMPHRNGFSDQDAKWLEKFDRMKNFVKHALVYERARERRQAIIAFEAQRAKTLGGGAAVPTVRP